VIVVPARKNPLDLDAEILTVTEVSKYLRVSVSTVYRLAEAGELPGFKVGYWRFHRATLEAWMAEKVKVSKVAVYPPRVKR
jgi:excisionase family DNA binding protein